MLQHLAPLPRGVHELPLRSPHGEYLAVAVTSSGAAIGWVWYATETEYESARKHLWGLLQDLEPELAIAS